MKTPRFACPIIVAALALLAAANDQPPAALKIERFDRDPGWEGFNNRLKPDPKEIPTIDQDFGWSDTRFAGGEKGELGGKIWRSVTPAFYAGRIPVKTLNDKLTASGKFAFTSSASNAGVWFGWFGSGRQQVGIARPSDALGLNLDFQGDGARLSVRLVNANKRCCGTFITPYVPGTFRTAPLVRGIHYAWTLTYDPQANSGNGRVEFMLNIVKEGNCAQIYFDDLQYDGKTENFDKDPGWEGVNNRARLRDTLRTGYHDFGFSPDTHIAGGSPGEVGGIFWRLAKAYGYKAPRPCRGAMCRIPIRQRPAAGPFDTILPRHPAKGL